MLTAPLYFLVADIAPIAPGVPEDRPICVYTYVRIYICTIQDGAHKALLSLAKDMGKKEEDLDGVKIDSSDFNVGYTLNEVTKMSVLMQEGKDTDGRKDTMTGVEVAYVVAPGMTMYVGYESTEVDSEKDNGMGAVLSVSF